MQSLTELFASLETPSDLVPAPQPAKPLTHRQASNAAVAAALDHDHGGEMEGQLTTAAAAKTYVLGGNATITLRSKKTGQRFTYKVSAPKEPGADIFFVGLLGGPDNVADYRYFGYIKREVYWHGRAKAKVGVEAPSQKAFAWAWQKIVQGELPETLEVWHEGSCGRCGRKLTVPSSIASGFGPECVKHVGG